MIGVNLLPDRAIGSTGSNIQEMLVLSVRSTAREGDAFVSTLLTVSNKVDGKRVSSKVGSERVSNKVGGERVSRSHGLDVSEDSLTIDFITDPLTYSLNHLLDVSGDGDSLTHRLTHSLSHSFTHSVNRSLTHSPTHSPTHPLIHSLTPIPDCLTV